MSGPELVALDVGDPPERWAALGFEVRDGEVGLGGVRLHLGARGKGIVGWSLAGVLEGAALDGLTTSFAAACAGEAAPTHPNGAVGLDHVVVVTPDFERTSAALRDAGLPLRRVREVEPAGFRQGFRRLGPAILELVEARQAPPGPARFWGLVVVVSDLDALAERLGEHLGPVKPAVQPGRRIATLRASAGLTPAVAFMDPEADA
ncbi:MAG TPA: VOC family protein [Solirubrobacteraceae bacterium]|nr:VOC family protein [Solirubrobacteraceae bacterium]